LIVVSLLLLLSLCSLSIILILLFLAALSSLSLSGLLCLVVEGYNTVLEIVITFTLLLGSSCQF
jgi:hypothetical protein